MREKIRTRVLWLLVAVTAGYGFSNIVLYYTTGSFEPAWFSVSFLVYGVLLVGALVLAFVDSGSPATPNRAPAPMREFGVGPVGMVPARPIDVHSGTPSPRSAEARGLEALDARLDRSRMPRNEARVFQELDRELESAIERRYHQLSEELLEVRA